MNIKAAQLAVIHNEMHSASKVVNLSQYTRGGVHETVQGLQQLIESFCSHIKNNVPHSGYSYRNGDLGQEIKAGAAGIHSCTYALTFEGEDLGELKLMRNYPFEDIELDLVEMLFCCLVYPLKNAIAAYKVFTAAHHSPLVRPNTPIPIHGRVNG
jgi:hypothetical protein